MKSAAFLLLIILIVLGVGAYMLDQRGLLTRESLELFLKPLPKPQAVTPARVEPVEFAASIRKREQELKEQTRKMEELATRLEIQRREIEAEKALLDKKLRALGGPGGELRAASQFNPDGESSVGSPDSDMIKLVKIYEGMPPEQAASILENLPNSTVAQILLQMRRRNATQIMAEMTAGKGAAISELLIPRQAKAVN